MDATGAGPEVAPAPESRPQADYLRWPPPGLERLLGDVWKIIRELFAGGLVMVLPLLWAVGETQPFHSAGPFGEAWWIVLLTTGAGLLVLVTACVDAFRLLRRAARATDQGYGWKTVALVAADGNRDTGFLLQGGRAYSVLNPPTRHTLAHARLWATGTWVVAAFWLPAGFVLAVLLASRGAMSEPGVVLFTLVPTAFLLVTGFIFRSWERGVLRKARKEWHRKPWSQDLEQAEIRSWHEDLGEREAAEHLEGATEPRAGRTLRLSSYAVVLVAIFIVVPSVVLVVSSSVSPILALVAVPDFSRTQQRAARVEALWRYRVPVDSAITPQQAGEILHVLESVSGRATGQAFEKAPVRTYEEDFYPNDQYSNNPTGLDPQRWPEALFPALDTLPPEALDHLRDVSAHPALDELSTLATAGAMDLASARWRPPFPDEMNAASFPIPRMSGLREAAYMAVARAAVATVDGRPTEAERTLREVITVGMLLGRDGTTLIDNLVGFVIAGAGAEALADFYRVVGRVDEAERLEWSLELAQRAAEKAQSGRSQTAFGAVRAMPGVVLDTAAMRGLRWEFFTTLNSIAPCMNVNRIVFGPDDAFATWLADSRDALVLYPSEEPIYDLLSRGWLGRVGDLPPRTWMGRLFTMTMGGEGPGSCARMFEELSTAGMIM